MAKNRFVVDDKINAHDIDRNQYFVQLAIELIKRRIDQTGVDYRRHSAGAMIHFILNTVIEAQRAANEGDKDGQARQQRHKS
jgi:hypothetical protein